MDNKAAQATIKLFFITVKKIELYAWKTYATSTNVGHIKASLRYCTVYTLFPAVYYTLSGKTWCTQSLCILHCTIKRHQTSPLDTIRNNVLLTSPEAVSDLEYRFHLYKMLFSAPQRAFLKGFSQRLHYLSIEYLSGQKYAL